MILLFLATDHYPIKYSNCVRRRNPRDGVTLNIRYIGIQLTPSSQSRSYRH